MPSLMHLGLANAVCAALLAALAWTVGRCVRRPALTHVLWLLVVVKLVTPPLFSLSLPWLPAPEPVAQVVEPNLSEPNYYFAIDANPILPPESATATFVDPIERQPKRITTTPALARTKELPPPVAVPSTVINPVHATTAPVVLNTPLAETATVETQRGD